MHILFFAFSPYNFLAFDSFVKVKREKGKKKKVKVGEDFPVSEGSKEPLVSSWAGESTFGMADTATPAQLASASLPGPRGTAAYA